MLVQPPVVRLDVAVRPEVDLGRPRPVEHRIEVCVRRRERIEQELASNPTLELAQANDDADTLQAEREQADRDDHEAEQPFLGSIDDLIKYARSNRLDEIFIALPWSADERITKLEHALSSLPCDIRLVPDLVGIKYKNRQS